MPLKLIHTSEENSYEVGNQNKRKADAVEVVPELPRAVACAKTSCKRLAARDGSSRTFSEASWRKPALSRTVIPLPVFESAVFESGVLESAVLSCIKQTTAANREPMRFATTSKWIGLALCIAAL